MPSALHKEYVTKIRPQLQKDLGITNVLAVPRVTKVMINAGIGSFVRNKNKDFSKLEQHLTAIAGQKVMLKKSRKNISNFKLRLGDPVGLMATLRGDRMYDFLSKLVNVALPRVRDFRGIPANSFDGEGNYSLGIREHYVFPEVNVEDDVASFGFQVTVVTSATTDAHAKALLKLLGFPFRDK